MCAASPSARPWLKLGTAMVEQVLGYHPPERRKYLMGGKLFFQTAEWLPNYSLSLAEVTGLRVYLNGLRKMKCSFAYNDREYKGISMTDPDLYRVEKEETVGNALLVVSLPDVPYEDKYDKFVAKIFPLSGG